jgi:glycogen debranching enzyme
MIREKCFNLSAFLFVLIGSSCCIRQNNTITDFPVFNVKDVPFSFPKSAFSVCNNKLTNGLALTDIRFANFGKGNEIFKFLYISGLDTLEPMGFAIPEKLTLSTENKTFCTACFESEKMFRLKGAEIPMILMLDKSLFLKNRVTVTLGDKNRFQIENKNQFGTSYYILTCLTGTIKYKKDEHMFGLLPTNKGTYEISVEETDSLWNSAGAKNSFDTCIAQAQRSFSNWLAKMPSLPEQYAKPRALAAYVLWSCLLDKGGDLKRPGILMSKNWMHYIWSWDHCFNAMACSYHLPEMAWNNFVILFDYQDSTGRIPDLAGYSRISSEYLKPPVHGWAFQKMMERMKFTDSQLKKVYTYLTNWTNFWLIHRDSNKNGIPEYRHGNDSGWDNGTEFDINGKSGKWAHWESANLSAYLIIQMDLLHELAQKLGYNEEAIQWKQKSDNLLSLMISKLWNGNKFVTINIENDSINNKSRSLMAFLPIILGNKLPVEIRSKLIYSLKNDGYLTKWGLATENINSPLYEDDGYWRGPIWAPSTMIIVDGLNKCGEHELAKEIARRFCDLCAKSSFAENFNAKTGEGLRDLAYTWTASCFLILGNYLLE